MNYARSVICACDNTFKNREPYSLAQLADHF